MEGMVNVEGLKLKGSVGSNHKSIDYRGVHSSEIHTLTYVSGIQNLYSMLAFQGCGSTVTGVR